MQYWLNVETGKVIAADGPAWGIQWIEIDEAEYQEALHPLTPANKVLHADSGDSLAESELFNDEMDDTFEII